MHFIEDSESKDRTMLKLWRTENDKVYIEMGPENEPDFMYSQFMTMDINDAQALAGEITRIVREIVSEAAIPDSNIGKKSLDDLGSSQGQPPKKNTADVHARYVKNGNGQMELMTAN